ncbi:hypothetical protein [Nocardioides sp. NPDC006273]|uniref:hypothetical protein n=1 Tax=Nocardioides sp. NPDC006273 TaxID=3155598 RepID=UPI0033A1720D
MNIAAARGRGPRWWLVVSLAFGLLTYAAVSYPGGQGPAPWIAVDLFLVLCIWRGSRLALGWYRLLQTLGLVVVAFLWVMSLLTDNVTVAGSPWPLLLHALSVWCAYASALTDHVGRAEPAPLNPSPTPPLRP